MYAHTQGYFLVFLEVLAFQKCSIESGMGLKAKRRAIEVYLLSLWDETCCFRV